MRARGGCAFHKCSAPPCSARPHVCTRGSMKCAAAQGLPHSCCTAHPPVILISGLPYRFATYWVILREMTSQKQQARICRKRGSDSSSSCSLQAAGYSEPESPKLSADPQHRGTQNCTHTHTYTHTHARTHTHTHARTYARTRNNFTAGAGRCSLVDAIRHDAQPAGLRQGPDLPAVAAGGKRGGGFAEIVQGVVSDGQRPLEDLPGARHSTTTSAGPLLYVQPCTNASAEVW